MGNAVRYIEDNLDGELNAEDIAKQACVSCFYFQKAFAMLCGFTVGEYIRLRRLTLAAGELVSTDNKIIDIAVKYGYDSPDSFTKAFTRFHGVTPSAVRKEGAMIKSFAPLKSNLHWRAVLLWSTKSLKSQHLPLWEHQGIFRMTMHMRRYLSSGRNITKQERAKCMRNVRC
jgi:AraC-like DNA-binding protein